MPLNHFFHEVLAHPLKDEMEHRSGFTYLPSFKAIYFLKENSKVGLKFLKYRLALIATWPIWRYMPNISDHSKLKFEPLLR